MIGTRVEEGWYDLKISRNELILLLGSVLRTLSFPSDRMIDEDITQLKYLRDELASLSPNPEVKRLVEGKE